MKKLIRKETASISIEACIAITVITSVLLFFFSILQIAIAQNILEMSLIRTGDKMCKWAPIYKYLVADNLQHSVADKLKNELSEELTDEASEMVQHVVNLNNISQSSMDYTYGYLAQFLSQRHIDESPFVKNGLIKMNNLNMYKSEFFHGNSNLIELKGFCEVDTFIPFDIKICYELNCGAWGKGVYPHTSEESDIETETLSIWSKDNYSRGKIIRSMYGANLPDNFPVISSFENGVATMIKSMNHTAGSYSDTTSFTQNVKNMINSLSSFNGKSWGGVNVKKEDIKIKRLLLIFPENDFSGPQELALGEIRRYASTKGILFDLRRYQKV